MSIYKACDIRGHATTELNSELYRAWGRALGERHAAGARFVVGGDVRPSTPAFLEALTAGLVDAGLDVVNVGQVSTPMVYFAHRHLRAAGCAIVTASHQPAEINGLKWLAGTAPPSNDELAALERAAAAKQAATGRPGGRVRSLDISPTYRNWLFNLVRRWKMPAHGTVVFDPGCGSWSLRAAEYVRDLFPSLAVLSIHDSLDNPLSGRDPDSARPENLVDLAAAVRASNATLGIAFDGDGDRLAMVDELGQPLAPEEAAWVLLQSFGRELAEQTVVLDVKFSDRLYEAARELGAAPVAERSGHAFIRRRMLAEGAIFGGEVSGHFFYGDLAGGDDALVSAVRLIGYLAELGTTLGQLRQSCPAIHMTPDLRVPLAETEAARVIDDIRRCFADLPQQAVDGARIDFPEGWALVRASVTEPKLTFRFEGHSPADLDRLVRSFCQKTRPVGAELLDQYEQALARASTR